MTEQEGRAYSKSNVEDAILAFLSERESASASEIAKASGIGIKTIRGYISKLLDDGTLDAIGTRNSPKRRYRFSG